MSKRLQVVLADSEMRDIRLVAKAQHVTVAEWVRQALRKERNQQPSTNAERKIQCVRAAATNSYPTSDMGELLRDIEHGRFGSGEG